MGYSLCKMLNLGHKLKSKKGGKNDPKSTLHVFCVKKGFKKQLIFEKWQVFENHQNLPLQNAHFGSKIKILIKVCKTTLGAHWSCSVKKTASENT